ncbi:hypothetical protein H6G36_10125 [Anabaena minutissima FACHB-250]|nr:hypothetical protein [Anabaena minutissima FACHB-250]
MVRPNHISQEIQGIWVDFRRTSSSEFLENVVFHSPFSTHHRLNAALPLTELSTLKE